MSHPKRIPFERYALALGSHDRTLHYGKIIPNNEQDFQGNKLYGLLNVTDPPDAAAIGTDGICLSGASGSGAEYIGDQTIEAGLSNAHGVIVAMKGTFVHAGTFKWFFFYLNNTGVQRVALYDHDAVNNRPGNLLVETASEYGIAGTWHQFAEVAQAVTPGDYWIAFQHYENLSVTRYVADAAAIRRYRSWTYGAFPSPFGPCLNGDGYKHSVYGQTEYSVVGARLYLNIGGTVYYVTPTAL